MAGDDGPLRPLQGWCRLPTVERATSGGLWADEPHGSQDILRRWLRMRVESQSGGWGRGAQQADVRWAGTALPQPREMQARGQAGGRGAERNGPGGDGTWNRKVSRLEEMRGLGTDSRLSLPGSVVWASHDGDRTEGEVLAEHPLCACCGLSSCPTEPGKEVPHHPFYRWER